MSKETNEVQTETETPVVNAVSELDSKAQPLGIIVPSGALSNQTFQSLNWFYPFLVQTGTVTPNAGTIVWPSAASTAWNYSIQTVGYASQNYAGLVFQNGQYNTTQRGF